MKELFKLEKQPIENKDYCSNHKNSKHKFQRKKRPIKGFEISIWECKCGKITD